MGEYILDFYCPSLRLAIELDGGHHLREEVHSYDQNRDVYLASLGVTMLRFQNKEVQQNLEKVVNIVSICALSLQLKGESERVS